MKEFEKYNSHKVRAEVMKIAHAIMKRGGSKKALKSGNVWAWAQAEAWKQYKAHLRACEAMEEGVVLVTFRKVAKKGKPAEQVSRYATANPAFIPADVRDYFVGGIRYAGKATMFYQFSAGDDGFGIRSYKPENFVRFEYIGRPEDVPATADDLDPEIADASAIDDILRGVELDLDFSEGTETDPLSGDYWPQYHERRPW